MKRKMLILAVLCLLIAALAITVYADEILTYNVTGVPDAVIGTTAYNGTVAVPAGVNYTGVEVQWYEAILNGEYWEFEEFSGKFANGKVYRRDTTVTGKFPWNEYFEVYISGMEADGHSCEDEIDENYYGKIVVEQHFYFTQEILSVEITGVTEPVLGQTASTSGIQVPTNSGYTVSAYWSTDDPEWAESDNPGEIVFKEGYRYGLTLTCTAKPGYAFPTGYTYSEAEDALQVTVNGQKCDDWWIDYWGSLYCTMWLDYDFLTPISTVSIDAPQPQLGQSADDLSASAPGNANYTVYTYWRQYDFEGNRGVPFSGVFTDGNIYGMIISVEPGAGYKFSEDTVVTLNGKAVSESSLSVYRDGITIYNPEDYIFGLQPIESVALTASVEAGKKADPANIKIPANAPYYFEEVGWMELDPKTQEYTTDEYFTGTFKEGYIYVCGGYIRPKDGYCFTRNTVYTVNGTWDERLNHMWGSYGEIEIAAVLGDLYDTPAYNGLVCVDGVWGYYEGGVLQTDYTGLVPYEDKIFYVEKGILTFTYTGLVYYMDEWRYVANSELTEGYTGLVYFNDNWFYTVNSRIDWTFTGIVEYGGNKFYVQNNLLDWSYTGLGYSDGEWYYFENALLKLDFTGLVYFDGTWFYVENGHLTFDYIGLAEYGGNRFYIQNNVLDWSYTGLGYHDGGWYYIENALLKADYNGLVYFNNTWFYIEAGELTWTVNGLHKHEENLFYIANSEVDWTYTGTATYEGTEYEVVNGLAVGPKADVCAHSSTHIEAKTATCMEDGWEKTICDACGNQVENTTTIPTVACSYETVTAAVAAKRYYDFWEYDDYGLYSQYTGIYCEQCKYCYEIDESSMRVKYTQEEIANEMLGYVNELRAQHGLDALTLSSSLMSLADTRSKEISVNFGHTTGYTENITNAGGCTSGCVNSAFNAFANSSGHLANMLKEDIKTFGCDIYYSNGRTYCVQLFYW